MTMFVPKLGDRAIVCFGEFGWHEAVCIEWADRGAQWFCSVLNEPEGTTTNAFDLITGNPVRVALLPFQCRDCRAVYSSFEALREHRHVDHWPEPGRELRGEDYVVPEAFLPPLGDAWGQWQCSGGTWHSRRGRDRVEIDAPFSSSNNGLICGVTVALGLKSAYSDISDIDAIKPTVAKMFEFLGGLP